MNELLQQVRVLDPVSLSDRTADVLIVEGKIQAIEHHLSNYPQDTVVRDCQNLVFAPGLVDLYSHTSEPGFEERETLQSLAAAALAGGFTRVALLPDTAPPIDNPAGVAQLQEKLKMLLAPQFYFWGAMTLGLEGQQMTELADLAAAGVVGFADGKPIENLNLLRRLLEYLKPLGKPLAFYPCSSKLAGNGVMREGFLSLQFGLPGNPALAETTALAALLEVVAAIQAPVHIMRVSTRRSVELIQAAKAKGLPVTASTTWMHLLLDTRDLAGYDPNLRLEPPLGNPSDREALLAGVKEGIIDAIAIDHSPYTYEEKTVSFGEAPAGAIGLELALPLLWHKLVETEQLSPLELWRCLSTHPSQCLNQKPAEIVLSQPVEAILFDPQATWTVEPETLCSRSANTPWLGKAIAGRVVKTYCSAG